MEHEKGEKRVFLPDFIQYVSKLCDQVVIEEGYGSRSGFTQADYRQGNTKISFGSRQDAFEQDMVLILRSPDKDFERMKSGTILMSMLHYHTRPNRIKRFREMGLKTISLDSIVNAHDVRLVENMKAVAWNGLEVAFGILEEHWPDLIRPDGKPINVLLLGTGMVGKHAVDAAVHLGNIERNNQHLELNGPGAVCCSVGRNLTYHLDELIPLLKGVDILIDATQRRNPSKPVMPNELIQYLPAHAILVDLSVDPYIPDAHPPVVRGIEGIPRGSLDKYVFRPEDPDWENTIAPGVSSEHRRTAVTCYSWPGFHPEACMTHYAQQLHPLMPVIFEKGYDELSLEGGYFEQALYRGTLKALERHVTTDIDWMEDEEIQFDKSQKSD
jgi:alanine dehydrogenase